MYSDILSTVRTSDDRELLLAEIEAIKLAVFEPKKDVHEILNNEVRVSFASLVREKLDKGEDLAKYLEGLGEVLANLREVKLELAQEPTERALSAIFSWLTVNLGEGVIVSLKINPRVLGGAIVSYGGKYYDGSLKKLLELTMEEQKDALIKMIYGK